MFGFIKKLLGLEDEKISEDTLKKASLIDVRSPGEFAQGHATNTVNVPLGEIDRAIPEFKKAGRPVVLCCASGNRSGMAARKLRSAGLEAYNAGSWQALEAMVKG